MKSNYSRDMLILLALTILCVAVYGRCVTFEHTLYDDPNIIFENANVQAGLTWESIKWAVLNPNFGLYMPLPTLTFMLDRDLFGDWAGGYHGMTLLWHVLCVCLFYWVMQRLVKNSAIALAAAALTAVHPVQTMTVNWISARNEIMPAIFMLLSLEMYRLYCGTHNGAGKKDKEKKGNSKEDYASDIWRSHRRAALFYLLSLVFMFLGIMSKQGIVMLPAVLLLLDYWPLKRITISFREFGATLFRAALLTIEKLPWFALSFTGALFAVYGKRQFGMIQESTLLPPSENVMFALTAYVRYMFHLVYPERYIMAYSVSPAGPAWWAVAGSALLLIGLTVLALSQLWKRPWVIVFWGWFVLFLLPVSGLVRYAVESIALRYLYVPSMGLYLLVGFGLYELAQRAGKVQTGSDVIGQIRECSNHENPYGTIPGFQNRTGRLFWTVMAGLILISSGLAFRQSGFWKNSETLAQRALAVTNGNNALAHNHMSVIRDRQGLTKQAFAHVQRAVELEPQRNVWKTNYAIMLNRQRRFKETLEVVGPLLKEQPDKITYLNLYGGALTGLLRFKEALPYLEHALEIEPRHVPSLYNYGLCLQHTGETEKAREYFKRVLAVQPSHRLAQKALEELEAQKGRE